MLTALLVFTSIVMLYSFKSQVYRYADFWEQLGISEVDGSKRISESFMSGYLSTYGAKNFKNIVIGERKAVTTDLLNYTKKYVQSPEFKKAYEEKRKTMKPREVTKKPRTEDQIRQSKIAEVKKGIGNLEKSMANATTAEMKKIYEDALVMNKKQLAEYEDPKNEMIPMLAKNEQQQYDREVQRYEERMKEWELQYPVESSRFVKRRLEEVLSETEGIDYNAELVEKNKKKVFVKPEYEKKNWNWKAGFRAGKEVTETVRGFMGEWVKGL